MKRKLDMYEVPFTVSTPAAFYTRLDTLESEEKHALVKEIHRISPTTGVIFMTGYANLDTAKQAIKEGAYDYIDEVIEKDVVKDHLLPKVSKFICPGTDVNMQEDARRLARTIVSDIVYYNSDTALKGVEDGTVGDVLKKEIEEGRMLYQQRVPVNIFSVTDYYDDAIRDFILKIQQSNLVLPSKFIS